MTPVEGSALGARWSAAHRANARARAHAHTRTRTQRSLCSSDARRHHPGAPRGLYGISALRIYSDLKMMSRLLLKFNFKGLAPLSVCFFVEWNSQDPLQQFGLCSGTGTGTRGPRRAHHSAGCRLSGQQIR